MPTVTLHIGDSGKLEGLSERDRKAYAKFRMRLESLRGDGASITFTWREPRSGPYHRRHFAMIHAVFSSQEQFDNEDQFRKWLEVGAGHVDFVPGPSGLMVALPKSINYESLDQAEFEPIHQSVFAFVRSDRAQQFLWPHLEPDEAAEMVESILMEFEQ